MSCPAKQRPVDLDQGFSAARKPEANLRSKRVSNCEVANASAGGYDERVALPVNR